MTRARDATARLFVAVDLPPQVRDRLADWGKIAVRVLGLRSGASSPARVLDPELLHLTLCFLGERPVSEIDAIAQALAECATAVGQLRIGAPLWLPPRRPRALAVEVRDENGADRPDRLAFLYGELCGALARACGHREQRRRFRAHVTVARLRGNRVRGPEVERPLPATPALSFTPGSVVLYRSWLSPAGARYEALAKRTLTPA